MRISFYGARLLSVLRLQELFQQEKGRKRLSVPPSPGRHRQTTPDDGKVGNIILIMHTITTHIQFLAKVFTPLAFFVLLPSNVGQEGEGAEQGKSSAS